MTNAQQQTPPAADKPRASGGTYIVGCKLPHGLKLELFKEDGTVAEAYTINGNNASRIVGGYGLTGGIPRDFMDEWLKRNEKHAAVRNQSIFIHTDTKSAEAAAKERREVRTGIEAIDPVANAKQHKLDVDSEAVKAYEKAKAENPVRNRQVQE